MSKGQEASRSEWPALLHKVMVMSVPELQLRDMLGYVALLHLGSVLMSNAPVTIESHVVNKDQGPCRCLRAILPLVQW